MSPKTKKILNIVVDVVCGAILIFVLILAISMITSKRKNYGDYTELFGKAYLAVASDSMAKNYETGEVKSDNFSKGEMIVVKVLGKDKKSQSKLKPGDIITFRTNTLTEDQTKYVLNTHRIVSIQENAAEYIFTTKGDNNLSNDPGFVTSSDVVGVYESKAGGIGNFMMFMGSSWGFFVFVVVPTLIIVVYAAANLLIVILKERKVQQAAAEEEKVSEREKMRLELMAEMGITPEEQKPVVAEPDKEGKPAEEAELEKEQNSAEDKAEEDK